MRRSDNPKIGDVLDLLRYEDHAVRQVLHEFESSADDSPQGRLQHGHAGKLLVEHLAIREAAKEQLADSLALVPETSDIARALMAGEDSRREALAQLDEMARGIQAINLNQGQDFDAEVRTVSDLLMQEITEELTKTIPALETQLSAQVRKKFPRAKYVRKHAPTHPNPGGRQWHERFGPMVRLHALFDFFRGFPTGGAKPSREPRLPGGEV
jgi:hypothetical protein